MKKEKLINAVEKIEDHFITEAEVYDPEKAKKKLSPGFFMFRLQNVRVFPPENV